MGEDFVDGGPAIVEQILGLLEEHGARPAILVDDGSAGSDAAWTHRDVLHRVRREARRLEQLGVGRGQVVALLTGDTAISLVLRWAVNVVGGVFVALGDGYAVPALTRLLDTLGVGVVLTDGDRRPTAEAAVAGGSGAAVVVDLDAAPPPADTSPVTVRAVAGDPSSYSLTGGSTGVPKGVPRHAAAYSDPERLAAWRDEVQLLCTPVAHVGGTVALAVIAAGGRVVLQPGFDPRRVLAAIARERVTVIQLMPRLLHRLLDHPDLPGTDTSSLRALRLGSAPASPGRIAEALERFGPVVGQTYGSIEATNITTIGADELTDPRRRGTVGRPAPGVEVAVRDDDGHDLPVGVTGEVWVRSAGVMPGYVNAPAATAAVLRDGWFDTGDLGALDADGYLTLVGRSKDVILGEHAHIHPDAVVDVLLGHPDVGAAAVVALADADGVESAVAAVVPRTGRVLDPAALVGWVVERRGRDRAPDDVRVVDALPALPSGKVDHATLRAELAGLPSPGAH